MEAQPAATPELSEEQQSPAKPEETKEQAFIRLAEHRMDRALTYIRLVGNLSHKSSYDWRPEDIEAISTTLHQAVDDAMARFRPRTQREGFKLRGDGHEAA